VLAFSLARWRRDSKGSSPNENAAPAPRGEDAERLEEDLGRYDL